MTVRALNVSGVSERDGSPEATIGTMYSPTTPREVTVVDGAQLIIAPPPAMIRSLTGARTCGARRRLRSAGAFIFDAVVTRRGVRRALRKSLRRGPARPRRAASRPQPARQCTTSSSNRSAGRASPALFRENTNLEWMVLAARERTLPPESIFRAGLRVRGERAVSAPPAATRPCRSPPPPRCAPPKGCRGPPAIRLAPDTSSNQSSTDHRRQPKGEEWSGRGRCRAAKTEDRALR
ncbi:unnamed protein product, partial [Iphiclides podalirius]